MIIIIIIILTITLVISTFMDLKCIGCGEHEWDSQPECLGDNLARDFGMEH